MRSLFITLFSIFLLHAFSQDTQWATRFEQSGGKATPRYAETIEYCKRLEKSSQWVHVLSFGTSPQGRELPLVVVDKDGLFDPASIHNSGRCVILVEACIHAGECEGKDAGLMLLRDLVISKKYPGLLEHVSILFIPIFNVDGHERFGPYNRINQNGPVEMGWRVTASNLNLNRDFLKADAPEMKAWLRMFARWMPDFFIDVHTTDGADYQYVLTYQMETHGNMDEGLTSWTKDRYIPEMAGRMEKAGYPVFHYIEFRQWFDLKSGLTANVAPPMLSQGYTSLRNRPGLLIETHMLKPYEQRVKAAYECIRVTLDILNKDHADYLSRVRAADDYSSSAKFREKPFPLKFKPVANDSSMVNFRGVSYARVKSDITGGYYYKYGKDTLTFPLPVFDDIRPSVLCDLPELYIIPAEWQSVIERLEVHGIRFHRLTKDTIIQVETCKFQNPRWQSAPYESRHPMTNIEHIPISVKKYFPAGSAVVGMNQPASRIIAQMLEPDGEGSLLYWGFFDGIFEQKEYAENYVMEEKAKQLLERDPELRKEFEEKKAADPVFASDPNRIMNWFLTKTPYWDSQKDVYPVGKIYDRQVAGILLSR